MAAARLIRFEFDSASSGSTSLAFDVEVNDPGIRSLTEHIMDVLRPLNPRETDRVDVYAIDDPARGAGTAELLQVSKGYRAEVRDAVRTMEIAALMGQPEVFRQEVLGVDQVMRPRTTNPYFLIVTGSVFVVATSAFLLSAITRGLGAIIIVMLVVLALVGVSIGGWLLVSGLRRLGWWHRARATARQHGRALPAQLRVWN